MIAVDSINFILALTMLIVMIKIVHRTEKKLDWVFKFL